jgi:hypothetical protein
MCSHIEENRIQHNFEIWAMNSKMNTRLVKKVNLLEYDTKRYRENGEVVNENNCDCTQ